MMPMSIAARILAGPSKARNGERAPRLESVNSSTSGSTGTRALIGLIAKSTEPPAGSVSASAPSAPGTGLRPPRNCDRAQNESKAVPQARRFCAVERATTSGPERPVNSASFRISTAPGLNNSPPIDEPSSKIAPAVAGCTPPARSKGDQDRAQHGGRASLADDRCVDEITGRNPARNQKPAHVPQRPE